MEPLSKHEQDVFREKALEWLSAVARNPSAPGNEHKPIYMALVRAILTIDVRDDEIQHLKKLRNS